LEKQSNDLIRNGTRDLPTCSIVSKLTTLPRAAQTILRKPIITVAVSKEFNFGLVYSYDAQSIVCVAYSSTVKMDAVHSSETSINFYQATRRQFGSGLVVGLFLVRIPAITMPIPFEVFFYYSSSRVTDSFEIISIVR
jgi:hypothetical protein